MTIKERDSANDVRALCKRVWLRTLKSTLHDGFFYHLTDHERKYLFRAYRKVGANTVGSSFVNEISQYMELLIVTACLKDANVVQLVRAYASFLPECVSALLFSFTLSQSIKRNVSKDLATWEAFRSINWKYCLGRVQQAQMDRTFLPLTVRTGSFLNDLLLWDVKKPHRGSSFGSVTQTCHVKEISQQSLRLIGVKPRGKEVALAYTSLLLHTASNILYDLVFYSYPGLIVYYLQLISDLIRIDGFALEPALSKMYLALKSLEILESPRPDGHRHSVYLELFSSFESRLVNTASISGSPRTKLLAYSFGNRRINPNFLLLERSENSVGEEHLLEQIISGSSMITESKPKRAFQSVLNGLFVLFFTNQC